LAIFTFRFNDPSNPFQYAEGSFEVTGTGDSAVLDAFEAPIHFAGGSNSFSKEDGRTELLYDSGNDYYLLEHPTRMDGNQLFFSYNDDGLGNVSPNFDFGVGVSTGFRTDTPGGSVFFRAGEVGNTLTYDPACFTLGTLISTPTGSTPVQDLHIGDLIINHLGESVPVKWIGKQRFHPAFAGDQLPICIREGALGNGLPLRDLYVSPGHAMHIDHCLLIDAKALVNGTTITQATQWDGDVEYFHIETEHHEIILAEGAPTETFMENVSRACFNNYSQYQALYPNAKEMIELDIPRVSHQRQLPNAVKVKLAEIAIVLMGQAKERIAG
jgi:hypothetical protein